MKKPFISMLLPTRGRRFIAERFINSIINTVSNPENIEIIIYLDHDDKESQKIDTRGLNCKIIIDQKRSMGGYNTACLGFSSGEIIILVNDDIIIRTKNWDSKIIEFHKSSKDKIYLAYPNDLINGQLYSTFPIISRQACDIIGSPFPEIYKRAFIDVHLFDIFKRLDKIGINRICYFKDIIFEHMHFKVGKSEIDENYSLYRLCRFDDDESYISMTEYRNECSRKILEHINKISKIEENSVIINDCRNNQSNFKDLNGAYLERLITFVLFDINLPFLWRLRVFIKLLLRKIYYTFFFIKSSQDNNEP